jgi:hypothetical protein
VPTAIQGRSVGVEIDDWSDAAAKMTEQVLSEVYK